MPKNKYVTKSDKGGSGPEIILNACYQTLIDEKSLPTTKTAQTALRSINPTGKNNTYSHIRTLRERGMVRWKEGEEKIIPNFGDDLIKAFLNKRISQISITKDDGKDITQSAYDLYKTVSSSKPPQWKLIKKAWADKVVAAAKATDKKFPYAYIVVIFLILRIDNPKVEWFNKSYLEILLKDDSFFKTYPNILGNTYPLRKHGFIYINNRDEYQLLLAEKLEEAILRDALKLVSVETFLENYRKAKTSFIPAENSPMSAHDENKESASGKMEESEASSDEEQRMNIDIDTDKEKDKESDHETNDVPTHAAKKPRLKNNSQLNQYKSTKTSDSNKELLINIIYIAASKQPIAAGIKESSIRAEYNHQVSSKDKHFQDYLRNLKKFGIVENNADGLPICPYIGEALIKNYLITQFQGPISNEIFRLYLAAKNKDANFNLTPWKQKIAQDNLSSSKWLLVTLWILAIEWGKDTFSSSEINQFLSKNSLPTSTRLPEKLRTLVNFNLITKTETETETENSLFTVNFGKTFEEAIICSVVKPHNSKVLINNYQEMKTKQPLLVHLSKRASNPKSPFFNFFKHPNNGANTDSSTQSDCTSNSINLTNS